MGQRKPEMRQDARPYLEDLAPYWAGVAQFTDCAGPHDMHSRRWECRAHWYLVDFSSQIPRPASFDREPVQACECTFQLLEWQTLAWFCARSWPCFAVRMGGISQELDFHGRREARNRPWGAAEAAEMDSNGRASMYAELARPCALFVGRSWPRSAVCLLRQLEKRLPSHPRKCFLEKTHTHRSAIARRTQRTIIYTRPCSWWSSLVKLCVIAWLIDAGPILAMPGR